MALQIAFVDARLTDWQTLVEELDPLPVPPDRVVLLEEREEEFEDHALPIPPCSASASVKRR